MMPGRGTKVNPGLDSEASSSAPTSSNHTSSSSCHRSAPIEGGVLGRLGSGLEPADDLAQLAALCNAVLALRLALHLRLAGLFLPLQLRLPLHFRLQTQPRLAHCLGKMPRPEPWHTKAASQHFLHARVLNCARCLTDMQPERACPSAVCMRKRSTVQP
jgi:hypothetical protein